MSARRPDSRLSLLARNVMPAIAGAAAVLLWYGARLLMKPDQLFLLPPPQAVLKAMVEKAPALWAATLSTGEGALIGFGAAVAVSFVFALLLSLSPIVRAGLYPYLMILQMVPIIVIAPILILWVGAGLASVTIITFLICFFPMVVNTTQGLISTDRNLVDFFRMCRATKAQEIFLLRVPAAMPYFFTGLRISATLATIGAIVGDVFAGNSAGGQGGLGYLTIVYSARFEIAALYATAAVSCVLGFVFVYVVIALSWLALHKWHDSFSQSDA